MQKVFSLICLIVFVVACAGCGSGEVVPDLAIVKGKVVDAQGKPLDKIQVSVLPDPEEEVLGRPAVGVTDASGRFEVFYGSDPDQPGSAVGKSRFIFEDIKVINEGRDAMEKTGEPAPRRFHSKYLTASTTDVRLEVKEGENDFEIKLDANEN